MYGTRDSTQNLIPEPVTKSVILFYITLIYLKIIKLLFLTKKTTRPLGHPLALHLCLT